MYAMTSLYLYKALFMAELLVAEFLTCLGMKRRPKFYLRLTAAIIFCIGFAFALPVLAYNALYCSVVFLLMFVFTLPVMLFLYDERVMQVFFRGFAAYTMQHIAYQIFDLVSLGASIGFAQSAEMGGMYGDEAVSDSLPIIVGAVRFPDNSAAPNVLGMLQALVTYFSYFTIYIAVYAIGYSFVHNRLRDSDKFELKNSLVFVFIVVFVLINVIATAVVTDYSGSSFDLVYVIMLALYNIASSFFSLFMLFEIVYRRQLERDYLTTNRLLKMSEENYELTKRNIELINLRCHDLKHQIHSLSADKFIDPDGLRDIEQAISVYDSEIHTGNEALDLILTEKSLYCNSHDIRLYCIINGALLKFISNADMYSLFGNLLDNAIEAVEKLQGGRRFINLSVQEKNGFVVINTSNCYESKLVFDGMLPQTTKKNKELHGFGMKSIRLICERYDGELSISTENGIFELSIIFLH